MSVSIVLGVFAVVLLLVVAAVCCISESKFISYITPTYPSCSDINITETLCDTVTSRQFVSVSSDLNPSVY